MIEKQLSNCWKEAYMKAKVDGYKFEPIEAFEYCRTQMPSGVPLLRNGNYQEYMDTKMFMAYLGMKDAEYKAQSLQMSTAQMHINKLFGCNLEMYLEVLNK